MKVHQLVHAVRSEVEKPFDEKLAKTRQLLRLTVNNPDCSVACSFGKDSLVVLHLALEINPDVKVVFGNTGIEFSETVRLAKQLKDEWNLNLSILKPETTFWKINERIKKEKLRLDDGRKHSNICCYHLKEKPFRKWAKTNKVNRTVTGITAIESRHRMFVACKKGTEYFSFRDGFWKVHPIMYWTQEEVWNFTYQYDLPVNEAYLKYGLERIGCMWCMSHKNWREQIRRINPKIYAFIMKRYFNEPLLTEYLPLPHAGV